MSKNSKIRNTIMGWVGTVAAVACVSITALMTVPVAAEGSEGPGGNESATNPTNCSSQTLGTCNGGGWTYVQSNEDPVYIAGASGNGYNFPGGTVTGCGKIGGYYISQWFRNGNPNDRVGIAANNEWSILNGPSAYSTSAKPWGEVEDAYKLAKAAGVNADGVDWNNVGWFCYSDALKNQKATVEAQSYIKINDDIYNINLDSEWNGYVGTTISTDKDTIDVTLGQRFRFQPQDNFTFTGKEFKIDYRYTRTGLSRQDKTWVGTSASSTVTKDPIEEDVVSIAVPAEGYSAWICRSVKRYYTEITFKANNDVAYGGDRKATKACVRVTHSKDPDSTDEGKSPTIAGNGTDEPMYIGEESSIGWHTKATGAKTRRLGEYQAISYLVSPSTSYSAAGNGIRGESRYKVNNNRMPCDYVRERFGSSNNVSNCAVAQKDANDSYAKTWNTENESGVERKLDKQQPVVVPEKFDSSSALGAKYCTTLGYRFEYWYAIHKSNDGKIDPINTDKTNGGITTKWEKVNGKDYWYIFDSACAPIAKKPQAAVWNGSVFANGNIGTLLSTRYNDTTMGKTQLQGGATKTYGSWVEYLGISNGSINSFISGASGSHGVTSASVAKDSNSTLTIANNSDPLGNANIIPNGEFLNRVNSYILESENVRSGDIVDKTLRPVNWSAENNDDDDKNKSQTTVVYKLEGEATIDQDITVPSGPSLVSQLPQIIIYIDGDLTIIETVSRIDAWLIVTGDINTCKEFKKSTRADGVLTEQGTAANDNCRKQLTFNGPVSAGSITLNRTYGSDARASTSSVVEPAEIFNFTPITYIWASEQSKTGGGSGGYRYNEVYSRELAPRS